MERRMVIRFALNIRGPISEIRRLRAAWTARNRRFPQWLPAGGMPPKGTGLNHEEEEWTSKTWPVGGGRLSSSRGNTSGAAAELSQLVLEPDRPGAHSYSRWTWDRRWNRPIARLCLPFYSISSHSPTIVLSCILLEHFRSQSPSSFSLGSGLLSFAWFSSGGVSSRDDHPLCPRRPV